jgi:LPS export ABC transporter protein LptC
MDSFRRTARRSWIPAFLAGVALLCGCNDGKHRTSSIDDDKAVPTMEVDSLFVSYTEKGLLRMTMQAPLVQRFMLNEEPYSIFPKGLHILFYTEARVLESEIVSDYALNKQKPEETWKATGNVVITNYIKGQVLYTDTLYWNRAQKRIYTDALVRIVKSDDEIIGYQGMTADERFEDYEIRNVNDSHVFVNMDDDAPQDSVAVAPDARQETKPERKPETTVTPPATVAPPPLLEKEQPASDTLRKKRLRQLRENAVLTEQPQIHK